MIVEFTTRFGHLTMLGETAVTLLRMAGHSGTVPGAILAADLPASLHELRAALETSGDLPSPAPIVPDGTDDADDDREREPPVSLRKRAVPFIDMIETAIARGSDLMWEPG
jgi:hypothetical protein